VNSRMAYVSVSRAQFDVQMYTNDAKTLGYELSRDVSHPTAIQQEPATTQKIEPQSVGMEVSQGLSIDKGDAVIGGGSVFGYPGSRHGPEPLF